MSDVIKKPKLSTGAIVAIVIVGVVVVSIAIALGVVFGSPKTTNAAAPTTPPASNGLPAPPPPARTMPTNMEQMLAQLPKIQFFTECNYGGQMTEKALGMFTWTTPIKSIKIPVNMELEIRRVTDGGQISNDMYSANFGSPINVPCNIAQLEGSTTTVTIRPLHVPGSGP